MSDKDRLQPDDIADYSGPTDWPVSEATMDPAPDQSLSNYRPVGKLTGKTAIVTGGDSGIGRAVATAFAMEGADVAIVFHENQGDADETVRRIEAQGRRGLAIQADLSQHPESARVVGEVIGAFGKLDILVNNAAFQQASESFESVPVDRFLKTIHTNIGATFWMSQAAIPHLGKGASIINTGSIAAFQGNPSMPDYALTKAAIHNLTASLSSSLAERGIRVNVVAPGPIWTPFIPAGMQDESLQTFGQDVPMGRPGQPEELAPAYVYFASDDSSYTTGATLQVSGG
jgi:NAD(P)-dependent dehydrogenase (short-subunit alcohol dehydrogenase family)